MVLLLDKIKNFYDEKVDERRDLKLNKLGVSCSSDFDGSVLNYYVKVHPERVLSSKKTSSYFKSVAKLIAKDIANKDAQNIGFSLDFDFVEDFLLANSELGGKLLKKVKSKDDVISFKVYGAGVGALGGLIVAFPYFSNLGGVAETYFNGEFFASALNAVISFSGSILAVAGGGFGGAFVGKKVDVLDSNHGKYLNKRVDAHRSIDEYFSYFNV